MRFFLPLAAVAAIFVSSGCAGTQTQLGATAAEPAISAETLKSVTERLASDEFEGRAPTTPGEEKTVRYIAERFQAAGLKPGNKGSWFQDVPLVEINSAPTPLQISGGRQPLTFTYRTDMVAST